MRIVGGVLAVLIGASAYARFSGGSRLAVSPYGRGVVYPADPVPVPAPTRGAIRGIQLP